MQGKFKTYMIRDPITWMAAFVRLVPGVCPNVLLEVGQLGELPLADLAPVGLDAEVDSGVLGKVGAVGKRLVAARALVRLRLTQVYLCVQLEVSLARKYLGKIEIKW